MNLSIESAFIENPLITPEIVKGKDENLYEPYTRFDYSSCSQTHMDVVDGVLNNNQSWTVPMVDIKIKYNPTLNKLYNQDT